MMYFGPFSTSSRVHNPPNPSKNDNELWDDTIMSSYYVENDKGFPSFYAWL